MYNEYLIRVTQGEKTILIGTLKKKINTLNEDI